jgi:hypothetical protein
MNKNLKKDLKQAADWLDELSDNLRAGNTLTKKHAQDIMVLLVALSEAGTTDEPLAPVKERVRIEDLEEVVSMDDLEEVENLPSWAIPRGKKK